MQKVETTHERKKHVITKLATYKKDEETGEVEEVTPAESKSYDSVNKAKKASVEIQQANGGLGAGAVQVVH